MFELIAFEGGVADQQSGCRLRLIIVFAFAGKHASAVPWVFRPHRLDATGDRQYLISLYRATHPRTIPKCLLELGRNLTLPAERDLQVASRLECQGAEPLANGPANAEAA